MRNTLKSSTWAVTANKIRECHLTLLNGDSDLEKWNDAFNSLITSIVDERKSNPTFATELAYLTVDTGFIYDLKDVLEEYFDHLEENKAWANVIASCETILNTFAWNNFKPSEYKYRIGNAYLKQGKMDDALAFGKKWLEEDPSDLYAVASNAFLLVDLGKTKEAKDLCVKFLDPNLVCTDDTMTVFMAAMRLYDITDDKNAKHRIEEKIAEYNLLMEKEEKSK